MTPVAADTYPSYLVISAGALIVGVIAIGAYRYWPRRKPGRRAAGAGATEIDEPPAERHVRTPSDVLRLIVGVLLVLIGLLFAAGASNTLVGFERDTISAFDSLPEAVARALNYCSSRASPRSSPPRSGCSCCGSGGSGCSACFLAAPCRPDHLARS